MNSFFANLYELLYYDANFSTAVFSTGLYTVIGVLSIIIPFIIGFVYYKIVDRPSFATVFIWLVAGGISAVLSFLVSYNWVYNNLADLYEFSASQYMTLGLISAAYSFLIYVLFSFLFKRVSINTKNIPF